MEKILNKLNTRDFVSVYEIMRQSFPNAEIRTYEKARDLLNNPIYQIFVLQDHEKNIGGFIAAWNIDEFRFVEHFAVLQKIRGAGIGSRMMKEYLNQSKKPVFIEVEEKETINAKRRIEFYRRLGFYLSKFGYLQPALQGNLQEIHLKIMSYPSNITESEFLKFKNVVFSQVYGTI